MDRIKGVDLSSFQSNLTMQDVKDAGYDFAILRGGFTGYGNLSLNIDKAFTKFYEESRKIGFPVGVYWYSCANNELQAIREAEYLYDQILKGRKFEYPIYIDVEEEKWQGKDPKGVTDAIIAFCDYLEEKGFFVGIYASLSWFKSKIQTSRLNKYSKWIASWTVAEPSFDHPGFQMWQHSGDISGDRVYYIKKTMVDTDFAFLDFPKIMKDQGLNGYKEGTGDDSGDNSGEDPEQLKIRIKELEADLSEITLKYESLKTRLKILVSNL